MATREQLLEVLGEYEAASPADLQRVVHLHEEQGGSLAELLLREELVGEEDLFFLMSRRLAVPAIPAERLRYLTLSPEIRRRVPRNLARECVLVPVDLDMVHGRLSVAMFDPTDQLALDKLRRISRVTEIRAYLARRSAIIEALDSVYSDADDQLAEEGRAELPLLGTGVPANGDAAQTAAHDDPSGVKVELDPSLALEIQAFEGYYPEPDGPPPVPTTAIEREEAPPRPRQEEVEVHLHGRQLQGRSLLSQASHEPRPAGRPFPGGQVPELEPEEVVEEELTQPFMLLPDGEEEATGETEAPTLGMGEGVDEVEEAMDHEVTQVRAVVRSDTDEHDPREGAPTTDRAEAHALTLAWPGPQQTEQADLLRELLASVGVLVSMLEERIDPSGGGFKEYGRLSRLVARELGLGELAVSRVALAAHLYGLDLALKREVGTFGSVDVAEVFGEPAGVPGGLGPSLRGLGARALGLPEGGELTEHEPLGVRLIRLVADFLELRAESGEGSSDMDTVVQLLRTGGGEPRLVDALARAVSEDQPPRLRLDRSTPNDE